MRAQTQFSSKCHNQSSQSRTQTPKKKRTGFQRIETTRVRARGSLRVAYLALPAVKWDQFVNDFHDYSY